jgi:hypothetical protein
VPLDGNHPVLIAMEAELGQLQLAYASRPDEITRYQLTRLESLIRQWAPGWQPARIAAV